MFDQLLEQNEEILKSMQSMMNLDAFVKIIKPRIAPPELQRSMLESLAEEQIKLPTGMMADSLEEASAVCQCESMPELTEIVKKGIRVPREKAKLSEK